MREKLIELLETLFCSAAAYDLADYLIANGVTIQKWIPVSERLPEKHEKYLVTRPSVLYSCEAVVFTAWYDPGNGFYEYDPEWGQVYDKRITHWMPLPEPPREEA